MHPNTIYLRREQKVIIEAGDGAVPRAWLATLLKNLEGLGYCCSAALIERLQTLSERDLVGFYRRLMADLEAMVGADVLYEPMYPGFPDQVMQADEVELYLNAVLHYLGDHVGARILPDYEKPERPPLADRITYKVIELGSEDDLRRLARQLIGAKTSLSSTDKADVAQLVRHYHDDLGALLPPDIPHKENLSYVAGLLLGHRIAADVLLTRYFKTATDVLRLATALSKGDVSLAENTRFRSFSRAERRLLLALLERCRRRVEDMGRHAGRWIRLGERLHPGEYRKRYPRTAQAFDVIRRGLPIETFAGRVEAALRAGDPATATTLLKTRPGELARRLDHLLRLSAAPDAVLEAFGEVAGAVSTPVLLQVLAHFRARPDPPALRAFFPKGNIARVATIPHTLPPIARDVCEGVVAIVRATLFQRFSALEPLGKVYLDEALRSYLVPFSQRSASKALRTLVRGSSLPLPAGDTIRFFLWWKEGLVEGEPTGRVDVDLSAVMYDVDWNYVEHISYTNLKSAKFRAVHSGDITSAPNGACEFIDLDIPSVVSNRGRYAVMSVLAYTRHPFCALPECFAGWMMRQHPGSGEVFEPATVVDRVDLAADKRIGIPAILDLVERRLIWADLALTSHPRWVVAIETNQRGMIHLGQALTTLVKPTLYDLFELHATARGTRVDRPAEADTVFSVREGVTPLSIEAIMADYL